MKNDELTTVEIYSGTVLECEILKSILADAEIECLFKNGSSDKCVVNS